MSFEIEALILCLNGRLIHLLYGLCFEGRPTVKLRNELRMIVCAIAQELQLGFDSINCLAT